MAGIHRSPVYSERVLAGATGVCCIGYVFPIYAYWHLPVELGGAHDPADARGAWQCCATWAAARLWPAAILLLGCVVSVLTLVTVIAQWVDPDSIGTCTVDR